MLAQPKLKFNLLVKERKFTQERNAILVDHRNRGKGQESIECW